MDHVYLVKSPYAKKLVLQELMGMLIVPRVELGSLIDDDDSEGLVNFMSDSGVRVPSELL